MKKADAEYVIVGKIGSTYGVHGWLKIRTFTEHNIFDYNPWYLSNGIDEWRPIKVEESRLQGHTHIAKLAGFHNPEEARLLTGKTIAITRSQLPKLKENEYYWSDLIGLTVINKDGHHLGKVIYIMATGSNDVLVIKNEKEHAIPYLFGDVILSIDLDKQQILVDWELV